MEGQEAETPLRRDDTQHVPRCMMRAHNYWFFCDSRETLVCMVSGTTEEMLDLDMEPKPESQWWTSTFQEEAGATLKVENRCHIWDLSFKDVFLMFKFFVSIRANAEVEILIQIPNEKMKIQNSKFRYKKLATQWPASLRRCFYQGPRWQPEPAAWSSSFLPHSNNERLSLVLPILTTSPCRATPASSTNLDQCISEARAQFFFWCFQVWSALPEPVLFFILHHSAWRHCTAAAPGWVGGWGGRGGRGVRLASYMSRPTVDRCQRFVPLGQDAQLTQQRTSGTLSFSSPFHPLKSALLPLTQKSSGATRFPGRRSAVAHSPMVPSGQSSTRRWTQLCYKKHGCVLTPCFAYSTASAKVCWTSCEPGKDGPWSVLQWSLWCQGNSQAPAEFAPGWIPFCRPTRWRFCLFRRSTRQNFEAALSKHSFKKKKKRRPLLEFFFPLGQRSFRRGKCCRPTPDLESLPFWSPSHSQIALCPQPHHFIDKDGPTSWFQPDCKLIGALCFEFLV